MCDRILQRCRGMPGLLAVVFAVTLSAPAIAGPEAEAASAAGDTAMQLRHPGEAILQYRRAQALGFGDTVSLDARIAGAEAQRDSLQCPTMTCRPKSSTARSSKTHATNTKSMMARRPRQPVCEVLRVSPCLDTKLPIVVRPLYR